MGFNRLVVKGNLLLGVLDILLDGDYSGPSLVHIISALEISLSYFCDFALFYLHLPCGSRLHQPSTLYVLA